MVERVSRAGTANSGHYYSYIQERTGKRRWFSFNDTSVSPWDCSANLEDDCFGGGARASRRRMRCREHSAFIVFYDRVVPQTDVVPVPVSLSVVGAHAGASELAAGPPRAVKRSAAETASPTASAVIAPAPKRRRLASFDANEDVVMDAGNVEGRVRAGGGLVDVGDDFLGSERVAVQQSLLSEVLRANSAFTCLRHVFDPQLMVALAGLLGGNDDSDGEGDSASMASGCHDQSLLECAWRVYFGAYMRQMRRSRYDSVGRVMMGTIGIIAAPEGKTSDSEEWEPSPPNGTRFYPACAALAHLLSRGDVSDVRECLLRANDAPARVVMSMIVSRLVCELHAQMCDGESGNIIAALSDVDFEAFVAQCMQKCNSTPPELHFYYAGVAGDDGGASPEVCSTGGDDAMAAETVPGPVIAEPTVPGGGTPQTVDVTADGNEGMEADPPPVSTTVASRTAFRAMDNAYGKGGSTPVLAPDADAAATALVAVLLKVSSVSETMLSGGSAAKEALVLMKQLVLSYDIAAHVLHAGHALERAFHYYMFGMMKGPVSTCVAELRSQETPFDYDMTATTPYALRLLGALVRVGTAPEMRSCKRFPSFMKNGARHAFPISATSLAAVRFTPNTAEGAEQCYNIIRTNIDTAAIGEFLSALSFNYPPFVRVVTDGFVKLMKVDQSSYVKFVETVGAVFVNAFLNEKDMIDRVKIFVGDATTGLMGIVNETNLASVSGVALRVLIDGAVKNAHVMSYLQDNEAVLLLLFRARDALLSRNNNYDLRPYVVKNPSHRFWDILSVASGVEESKSGD